MTALPLSGWDRLRHGGLLLDAQRLGEVARFTPAALNAWQERELRRRAAQLESDAGTAADFVAFVLEELCGFSPSKGSWLRGNAVPAEWSRRAVTGETVRPRQLWATSAGAVLPVFFEKERKVGTGRGRRTVSQVLQWLRGGREQLALLTNGRQWRLIFAGLDFDAWCEGELELWFEEGALSPQLAALRTLLAPAVWEPAEKGAPAPLLQAILDSRKGQAELSAVLGERVREAVEILVQAHGEILKERCADVPPAEIYRAAVRVVMRLVVVLFAESRELLPRDNAIYHGSYGVTGLLEALEKLAARTGRHLTQSWSAWPRLLALFRLVHQGSHHPELAVPAYGGELFAPAAAGGEEAADGLTRALAVFESACFEQDLLADRDVLRMLGLITRTQVRLRQGKATIAVQMPVDFSDLSSEYIGILYEGLLDFELRTVPSGDPVIFLAVGDQPALPLSRLEAMDDAALKSLLEAMKDKSRKSDEEAEGGAEEAAESAEEAETDESTPSDDEELIDEPEAIEEEAEADAEIDLDPRHTTRTRAEAWARRAAVAGSLVRRPKGKQTPERLAEFETSLKRKARQLVTRVVLPGEWYLVRWGGTRKGSGTFYTRPGLAVPTVQRTLRPLAYDPPAAADGTPDLRALAPLWVPKAPEAILALQVCDPACGSGSFPVAALRFLTDALYASLHHHGRIRDDGDRSVVALLGGEKQEHLATEMLPCRPDDDTFEPRLKALLRRYVVERCLYGVDIDPLAVELCRLTLWVETMDRDLPFSFLDHKIKCGNSLVGAWFDTAAHYPAMAWMREAGDEKHTRGVHSTAGARAAKLKAFKEKEVKPALVHFLSGKKLFSEDQQASALATHETALDRLQKLHELPVHDAAERARRYRDGILGDPALARLRDAFDLWCACWFWPAEEVDQAPLPADLAAPRPETLARSQRLARAKRFFHWELEFPEVFTREKRGFDAILGNPPWDVAKPNSKEFFSNLDPLYRAYGKQVALRRQTELFADEAIERAWLDYSGDFRALSNFMGSSARPFGDPVDAPTNADRFGLSRSSSQNLTLHNNWRVARSKSRGFADAAHPFRHQGSGDVNLYKLFLEQAHGLLRFGGRLGFLVPSGLYSDHGSQALRRLFLDRCRWEWIFGFENRDKVFDIDSRFKFNPVIVEKGGTTVAIRTAFMRRRLEDWARADELATDYPRERVEQFSPRSAAILEIQTKQDLEILESAYSNASYLGELEGPGWGIECSRELHMTDDSGLFTATPKWEARGFSPDDYCRWTIGSTEVAVPLLQGIMLDYFNPNSKKWLTGSGVRARWEDLPLSIPTSRPQYLMSLEAFEGSGKAKRGWKLAYSRIRRTTDTRTLIGAVVYDLPAGDSVFFIYAGQEDPRPVLLIAGVLNSFVFDYLLRTRMGGTNVSWFYLAETGFCTLQLGVTGRLEELAARLNACRPRESLAWLYLASASPNLLLKPWARLRAVATAERLRLRVMLDAIVAVQFGLSWDDINWILKDCDRPCVDLKNSRLAQSLNPKGFWRVDKEKNPELRHSVLTLVALRELEGKIRELGDDRQAGIAAFCSQNDGEGWMLPDALCLYDYSLGHDERAKRPQPVASRLGPRFYDWQLAQTPEESWRECHLHARNLLGDRDYQQLLREIESGGQSELAAVAEPTAEYDVQKSRGQLKLL